MTRVLYMDVQAPTPDTDAMSEHTVQMLEMMRARGWSVDFAPILSSHRPNQESWLHHLGVNVLPWRPEDHLHAFLRARAAEYDIIHVAWLMVARRFIAAAREAAPHARIVFDTGDVHHLREYRHARVTGNQNTLKRALLTRQRERDAMAAADVTLAITEPDAAVLRALLPGAAVHVVTMWCEPTADLFRSGGRDVVFLGNYGAAPNYDAAHFLARQVWPRVRAARPDARLVLAGAHPNEAIQALAAADIAVTGWVPDLNEVFAHAAVAAIPLRFGAGVKSKVLQALARGVPLVASTIALEGIELTDGIEVLIADDAPATAAAILRVLDDPALGTRLATAARRRAETSFSRAAIERQFDAAYAALMAVDRPARGT